MRRDLCGCCGKGLASEAHRIEAENCPACRRWERDANESTLHSSYTAEQADIINRTGA